MPSDVPLQELANHVISGIKKYCEEIGQSALFDSLQKVFVGKKDDDQG
jgi:hypothetical protein